MPAPDAPLYSANARRGSFTFRATIALDSPINGDGEIDIEVEVEADLTPPCRGEPRSYASGGSPDEPGSVEIVAVIDANGRDRLAELRAKDSADRALARDNAASGFVFVSQEERLEEQAIEEACAA